MAHPCVYKSSSLPIYKSLSPFPNTYFQSRPTPSLAPPALWLFHLIVIEAFLVFLSVPSPYRWRKFSPTRQTRISLSISRFSSLLPPPLRKRFSALIGRCLTSLFYCLCFELQKHSFIFSSTEYAIPIFDPYHPLRLYSNSYLFLSGLIIA